MNPQTTLLVERIATESVLYMAFDLGKTHWYVALSDGAKSKVKRITAGDFDKLLERIKWAMGYFEMPKETVVLSCHEAGSDGFWVHRALEKRGICSVVIDPGSLEAPRNRRRVKTDRIDAENLVRKLINWWAGDRKTFSVVHVPSKQDEDDRRLARERNRLTGEKTAHINRIRKLLATQGLTDIPAPHGQKFLDWLDDAKDKNGQPIGTYLEAELRREKMRLNLVIEQIDKITEQQMAYLDGEGDAKKIEMIEQMMLLKSIGLQTAWVLVMEMFGWRKFQNRRQVGAYAGLCGTPHITGGGGPDKGISKAGNALVRWVSMQLAWNWLRWQPDSELSKWYVERFDYGAARRKKGAVALARKLLNRMRCYLQDGEVPNGARLKIG